MSWSKEITIWCDGCLKWDQIPGSRIKEAEREVIKAGWTKKGKKHYCKDCSGNIRRREEW